jgi:hypothetical protein
MKPTIDENRIAFAGDAATIDPHQHFGRLVTRGEQEQHARCGVHAGVQAAEHRRQHDGVHDVVA